MDIVMQTIGKQVLDIGLWKLCLATLGFGGATIFSSTANDGNLLTKIQTVSLFALTIISAFFTIVGYLSL